MSRFLPRHPLVSRFAREMVRPYLGRLVLTLALMAVVSGITGLYPLAIDRAFEMLAERDPRAAWLLPPLVVGLTAAKGLALYAQTLALNDLVRRLGVRLQRALFDHLMRADVARFAGEAAGGLVTRFTNDVNVVLQSLARVVTSLVRDLLTVLALLAAMLYLDWALTLIVLLVYPLAVVPLARLSARMRRLAHSMQAHTGSLTSFLHEAFTGIRLVKAYRLEAYQEQRAAAAFEHMADLRFNAERVRARVDPLLEVLGGVAVAGVLAVGGWRIASGAGTVGDFTGLITALLIAAQPMRSLGNLNVAVQEGIAALERAYALLDEIPCIRDDVAARPLRIEAGRVAFERVSFAYSDAAPAVTDVSFELEPGGITALVGASGAGKTTIFNLVPRFFEVTDGRILIDGQNIRDVTLASLREQISLVSQEVVLFDETVRRNIALGTPEATDADTEAAARAAAADGFIRELEDGYETHVGPGGGRLSGGQRQRIALARAMLRSARILLLDEATSALDAENEREVQEALAAVSRNRTTLVIAHRLATVRRADRIVVLDAGRVVEIGTHDQLLAADGAYARLARLQFQDRADASAAD